MTVSQTAPQSASINQLIPIDFEETPVRLSIDEHGAPWFHAGDVCRVLEYGNPRQALDSHVDPEDVQKLDVLSAGGTQQTNFVNESGLYALIFGSTKPEAKRFKRWVTAEVLPTLRKTGGFGKKDRHVQGVDAIAHGLERLVQVLNLTGETNGIRLPPRNELRVPHKAAMSFQQAIRLVHIEYGLAWTTSLAISLECRINHDYLVNLIDRMLFNGELQHKEHDRMRYFPDQSSSSYPLQCLTEQGFRTVMEHIDQAVSDEEKAKVNLQEGGKNIVRMFEAFTQAEERKPGRPSAHILKPAISKLAEATLELARAASREG